MDRLLAKLTKRSKPPNVDARNLESEKELQTLRLTIEENERMIANLKQEIERQRSGAQAALMASVQTQMAALMQDAAAPVSQLLTQIHLVDVEQKPVAVRDILAVARRLVGALQAHGLSVENRIGDLQPFDPNLHELLSHGSLGHEPPIQNGQPVKIRFSGIAYQGKLLSKAGVSLVEKEG